MTPTDSILKLFDREPDDYIVHPVGLGHIHDTYHGISRKNNADDFILQRLNDAVFQDIELLMNNFELVTGHLIRKSAGRGERKKSCIRLIYPANGGSYIMDQNGRSWRMMNYIHESLVFMNVEDPVIAEEGGKAYAEFEKELADLDGALIGDTIPRFHHLKSRYKMFKESLATGIPGRIRDSQEEIKFVEAEIDSFLSTWDEQTMNTLPERIVHNDTKINNLLFDKEKHALCVIDLDTVMKGRVHYDFGDAIRTFASTAGEDEENLGIVDLDQEIFEAFVRGYMSEASGFLTDAEVDLLPEAPRLLTFIMGLRFLTDYIAGDIYFKVDYPDHNLNRSRNQFHLVRCMELQASFFRDCIYKYRISGRTVNN